MGLQYFSLLGGTQVQADCHISLRRSSVSFVEPLALSLHANEVTHNFGCGNDERRRGRVPGNRREAYHQHGQVCEGPGEEIPVTAKIRLSDNISPSAFGDPPDPHTVDGRRR